MRWAIRARKLIALVVATSMLLTVAMPAVAPAGTPADDLKQIQYKYYFRGKYQQAIESLQTYLARVDVRGADAVYGREFLAASYVLGGAPDMGKDVFTRIIVADPAYAGPDPGVFKLDVMDAYARARSEYVALTIKNAPATASTDSTYAAALGGAEAASKPIYKKWWFYAGLGAVALVAGLAAGGGGDGGEEPRETGGVVVGVTVH